MADNGERSSDGNEEKSHVVAVWVPIPRWYRFKARRAAQQWVNSVGEFLTHRFGGASGVPAFGFWRSPRGKLYHDSVIIVYSFTDVLSTEDSDAVLALAASIRDDLREESVSVLIDGRFILT